MKLLGSSVYREHDVMLWPGDCRQRCSVIMTVPYRAFTSICHLVLEVSVVLENSSLISPCPNVVLHHVLLLGEVAVKLHGGNIDTNLKQTYRGNYCRSHLVIIMFL